MAKSRNWSSKEEREALAVLFHPVRLRVFDVLTREPLTASEIGRRSCRVAKLKIRYHCGRLLEANAVEVLNEGTDAAAKKLRPTQLGVYARHRLREAGRARRAREGVLVSPSDKVSSFEAHDSYRCLERVLLVFVLDEHPVPVTLFEGALHLERDPNDIVQAKEVDLLSRQLVEDGLLHRVALTDPEADRYAFPDGNKLVQPTKAALHARTLRERSP